jgi:hypothetical protein
VLALALVGFPPQVRAQALHVYGPDGTPAERRALVVVEEGGGCAPAGELELASPDPGVTVELGEAAGSCARWVTIRAQPPRTSVRIEAAGNSTAVAMGSDRTLAVRVDRRGRRITARIEGAAPDEEVRVLAFWPEGEAELSRDGDAWHGDVPADALVGVVVRSGGLVGAAASAPGRLRAGPAVLLMPSHLAVAAGGAPRTAAFLAVVDRRGRLSRNVPLRLRSEHGRLRRLEWSSPGLAAVGLSVDAGVDRLDLSAHVGGAVVSQRELEVSAGWPAEGWIEASESVELGEAVHMTAGARTVDGASVEPGRLRARCGDAEPIAVAGDGTVRCDAGAEGPLAIGLAVLVDGRAVPLAAAVTRVVQREPVPIVAPVPVASEAEPPAPALPREDIRPARGVAIGALAHGGIDAWGRPSVGGGARARVPVEGPWALGVVLRYAATPFSATPAGAHVVDGELTGTRHATELALEGAARGRLAGVGVTAWVDVGLAWVRESARLGNATLPADGLTATGSVAVGPYFELGSTSSIELAAGARFAPVSAGAVWAEPPVRLFVEVAGAIAP